MRVFCASMADVFDKDAPEGARERLWALIDATPFIDWQLLTKRIGNVGRMIPDRWSVSLPFNVWLGATVVNQEEVDRDLPKLLAINAHTLFVSIEPMLGAIDLGLALPARGVRRADLLNWVICGGESGGGARAMNPAWAVSLRDQCAAADVAFHFKQFGEFNESGDLVGKKRASHLLQGSAHKAFPRSA